MRRLGPDDSTDQVRRTPGDSVLRRAGSAAVRLASARAWTLGPLGGSGGADHRHGAMSHPTDTVASVAIGGEEAGGSHPQGSSLHKLICAAVRNLRTPIPELAGLSGVLGRGCARCPDPPRASPPRQEDPARPSSSSIGVGPRTGGGGLPSDVLVALRHSTRAALQGTRCLSHAHRRGGCDLRAVGHDSDQPTSVLVRLSRVGRYHGGWLVRLPRGTSAATDGSSNPGGSAREHRGCGASE